MGTPTIPNTPTGPNTPKTPNTLPKQLAKKLSEVRNKAKNTEKVYIGNSKLAKEKNEREKEILNDPICKSKGMTNIFTCKQMIGRRKELNAIPRYTRRNKNGIGKIPIPSTIKIRNNIPKEEIKSTFIESKNGTNLEWRGKNKKTGTKKLIFPGGCTDTPPGFQQRIFTHKGTTYPKWCRIKEITPT